MTINMDKLGLSFAKLRLAFPFTTTTTYYYKRIKAVLTFQRTLQVLGGAVCS